MSGRTGKSIDLVKWLGPLLLSIVAIVFTYLNYESQNQKWENLNGPRFVLVPPPHFAAFEELDAAVAKSRKWGYQPLLLFYVNSDGLNTGKLRRYSELIWWSLRASRQEPGNLAAATLKEAEINGRLLNRKDFALKQHFRPHFEFRNSGSLPATNVVWRADARWSANGEWQKVSQSDHSVPVDAGGPVGLEIDAWWPIDVPFPKEVQFRFRFDWDGEKEPWVRTVRYDFSSNTWGPT